VPPLCRCAGLLRSPTRPAACRRVLASILGAAARAEATWRDSWPAAPMLARSVLRRWSGPGISRGIEECRLGGAEASGTVPQSQHWHGGRLLSPPPRAWWANPRRYRQLGRSRLTLLDRSRVAKTRSASAIGISEIAERINDSHLPNSDRWLAGFRHPDKYGRSTRCGLPRRPEMYHVDRTSRRGTDCGDFIGVC
jgi:hypothetical protein